MVFLSSARANHCMCTRNHTDHSKIAEALSQTPCLATLAFLPKVLPNQQFPFSFWKQRAMGQPFPSIKKLNVIAVLSSPTSKEGLSPITTKIQLRIISFHSCIPGDI